MRPEPPEPVATDLDWARLLAFCARMGVPASRVDVHGAVHILRTPHDLDGWDTRPDREEPAR